MNAYELADKLQMDKAKALLYVDTVVQSAEMLRQQADRIAELEKFNKAILKKGGYPHKSLSDEEIYELWCEADNTELLPEMRLKDGSINYIITTFAKLIEERHGIK